MASYYHYYRCGCVNWASNKWVEEASDSGVPGFIRAQHFELNKAAKCQRYLRYARTEKVLQQNRTKLPIDDPATGVSLVIKDARSKRGPTIAVMWDAETSRWYHGSCGHNTDKSANYIPWSFVNYVSGLEVDPKTWAFGWNCAEVECVVKAYKAGKTKESLEGCYFVAYSVSSPQGLYGACLTCKNWINHFGGSYLSPRK